MVKKYPNGDRKITINSFDVQPSKLKPHKNRRIDDKNWPNLAIFL